MQFIFLQRALRIVENVLNDISQLVTARCGTKYFASLVNARIVKDVHFVSAVAYIQTQYL